MLDISRFKDQFLVTWGQAVDIWSQGGWAMWAIGAIALAMFGMGVHIALRLRETAFLSVPERRWRRWVEHPAERQGPIGRLLDRVTEGTTLDESRVAFEQVRIAEQTPFLRDLKVMKICVSSAPLVGLLGTVTGMLSTFGALASGSGGDKTMGLIAAGISEALITTETGLVVALPGLFLQYHLSRKFERYRAFLAHVETVCTQALYRRSLARRGERSGVPSEAEAEHSATHHQTM